MQRLFRYTDVFQNPDRLRLWWGHLIVSKSGAPLTVSPLPTGRNISEFSPMQKLAVSARMLEKLPKIRFPVLVAFQQDYLHGMQDGLLTGIRMATESERVFPREAAPRHSGNLFSAAKADCPKLPVTYGNWQVLPDEMLCICTRITEIILSNATGRMALT